MEYNPVKQITLTAIYTPEQLYATI